MMVFDASVSKRKRLREILRPRSAFFLLLMLAAIQPAPALALNGNTQESLVDALYSEYNCSSANDPLSSLEELLRGEAQLLSSFGVLLNKTNTTVNETIIFLDSFEDLLRRQTVLYSGFESLLKSQWYRLDCLQQKEFLDSFEDLLHREVKLFARFNSSIEESWPTLPNEEKVKLLESFEDLLRRQTKLFKSFEELYMMTNGGLTVEKYVNKTCICRPGETVKYWYVVKNWYNQTITNVSVVDDHLGKIAQNITLGPNEERTFYMEVSLTGSTCNTARAYGEGPCGEMLVDDSNTVCVNLLLTSGNNFDKIVVGQQFALTSGSDPPMALNTIEIKKNQKIDGIRRNNTETIWLGDQKACGLGPGGQSSNSIKIVTNQE